jgi:hypothetical protein
MEHFTMEITKNMGPASPSKRSKTRRRKALPASSPRIRSPADRMVKIGRFGSLEKMMDSAHQ